MRRNTKAKTVQNKTKQKQNKTGQGLLVRGGLST
jgi:hypothetical protein